MSWKAEYIILIVISTLVDYIAGIKIEQSKKGKKKTYLFLSLFTNLGLLFAFKYFNFFSDSFRIFLSNFTIQLNPMTLKVLLPVGISFYTFQTLSYTIDVYRERIKAERHLGIFAVYVSFFPQLVAGPIERAKNLLPQFYKEHRFDYKRVTNGLKLMLWGFFKKIVIADRLALFVDAIYNNVNNYSGIHLMLATVFFAYQIYCDFSGYSDIAIGASQVMGISLMDNFKRPYFSKSISEFWKRWHISLSSWFRDYLYIPLGGNRVKISRWSINILIVFIVSGLWHGASWTFIIWGALHGFYLLFGYFSRKYQRKIIRFVGLSRRPKTRILFQVIITFILVNIGWVFFRANSYGDAIYIFTHFFTGFTLENLSVGFGRNQLFVALLSIVFLEFVHLIQEHVKMREFLNNKPIYVRWTIYYILIISIIIFGVFKKNEFIYFQF